MFQILAFRDNREWSELVRAERFVGHRWARHCPAWARRFEERDPFDIKHFHQWNCYSIPVKEIMTRMGWFVKGTAQGHGVCHWDKPSLTWLEFAEYLLRQGIIIEAPKGSDMSRDLEKHLSVDQFSRFKPGTEFGEMSVSGRHPVKETTETYRLFFSSNFHPKARGGEQAGSGRSFVECLDALLENNPTKFVITAHESYAEARI